MKVLFKILFATVLCGLVSCSDMDNYKEFTEGGEITYTGMASDLQVFPGHNRVMVQYVMVKNPNINRSVIYWNGNKDSVIVEFDRMAMKTDTMKFVVENLAEGSYSFVVYNFDKLNNKSVPAYKSGRAYGDRYITGLYDRSLLGMENINENNDVYTEWGDSVMTSVGVEFQYTNADGKAVKQYMGQDEMNATLKKCRVTDNKVKFKYRTLYKPDTTAIDTFYTSFVECELDKYATPSIEAVDKSKFAEFRMDNDAPKKEGDMAYLWDGRKCTNPDPDAFYNDVNYQNYHTGYDNGESASFTVDLGEVIELQRFQAHLYWPYMSVCPKLYELYGYTEEGEPAKDGNWGNWTKLASFDNSSAVPARDYAEGNSVAFTKMQAKKVRYIRVKCLENFSTSTNKGNMSLSEITVWKYSAANVD